MKKKKNAPNNICKVGIVVLSVFQIIFLAWGWFSYVLGSVTASLFTWLSFFSLLWYPVDWGCKHLWMVCDVLKQRWVGQHTDFDISARQWERHFPVI